jgi:flavodoxin/Pyruvate/2-oxoacid:ferredoxin oxidoreductase delta subunit
MSKAVIYYFSGTGNSLFIARKIAGKTDSVLIPIPAVINYDSITCEAEIIGIVFPVYYATNDCGVPLIVSRFIKKLKNINSKYIFAVCTSGYMSGETIENLSRIIKSRGGKLSAGYSINMSNKDLGKEIRQKLSGKFTGKQSITSLNSSTARLQKKNDKKEKKIELIADAVNNKKPGKLETRSIMGKLVFAPLLLLIKPVFKHRYEKLSNEKHLPFNKLIQLADRSFNVNDKCNVCSICEIICPVNNIKMKDNKPLWCNHCENCLACYQWCPNEAIFGDIVEYEIRHHHHEVNIQDMIQQKYPEGQK